MSALTPYIVKRHADGEFAGKLEHFFPAPDSRRLYALRDAATDTADVEIGSITEALKLVRAKGYAIKMRGNLTGKELFVPAGVIQCL